MKGLVPIGGRGTRMRPVTYSVNKHFIPVANKMLVEYPIMTLVKAGIKEIGITYNPGQLEYAKEVLGDGRKWGAKFWYILQPEPKGLANIVEVAEEFLKGSRFVFHLGDNIFVDGIDDLVESFDNGSMDGMVTMVEHEENVRMGVPYFDKKGRLLKYVEKPKKPPHKMAVPGLYFLSDSSFGAFRGRNRLRPSARGEYEIPDLYQWMIDKGLRIEVRKYEGKWLDPGKFGDWLESNQYLLDRLSERKILGKVDKDSRVEGRVEIGKKSRVINSVIRGPVRIGERVVVKDSFVGPYTSIYHGSKIVGCRVENSVLMEGVELDNMPKVIDNSILGNNTVVKSVSQNGALGMFLGEGSRVEW